MTGRHPLIDETLSDAAWLAHRYDPSHDAVHFIAADRARRSNAAFLTDTDLSPGAPRVLTRRDAIAACPPPAPIHFIFHSAYCGSTLLSRALDIVGTATTLKEPQILNDLVGWRHRGGDPRQVATTLDTALTLLARPFQPGERCVVKPSNVVNGLTEAMLAQRPLAQAVFLYAPLPVFVASIARKGLWGRRWVRDLLSKQLNDGLIDLGFAPQDYLLLTDLQVAAVGWLAQQALFTRLAHADRRVRMMDSETMVTHPHDAIAAAAGHFDLPISGSLVDEIVGREFARDAKTGAAFGREERRREHDTGHTLHADEITKVVAWADAVAANAGVLADPDEPLRLL